MKRYLLFISILLISIADSLGQRHSYLEYAGGTISSSVTWSTYDTVYILGNVTVTTGGSLTISPNTSGSDIGTYIVFVGNFGITVLNSGLLNVNGTASERIYFTADRPETNLPMGDKTFGETGETWQNISLDQCNGTYYTINYEIVEYGTGNGYASGGGIDVFANNVTITNTEVRYCVAAGGTGGGIALTGGNSYLNIVLNNLTLHHNQSAQGGGLWMDVPVPVDNCSIYNNSTTTSGSAGIYVSRTSYISNTTIYSNYSTAYSGSGQGCGVWINGDGAQLRNCLVYNNTTGVYTQLSGGIINSTIVNNGTGVIPSSAATLLNTILWGNTTDQYTGTSISFANCGIQGGIVGGTDGGGNVNLSATNADPAGPNFMNASSNFHIGSWNNPLTDAGVGSYSGLDATTNDYDNAPRINTVDIGAYEFLYYNWTGATSSDPSLPGNWLGSFASIPTDFSQTQVIIPDACTNYPTFSSLTLSNGSRAVVEAAARLTVTGATTVNSGCTFVLRSGASSSANFITGSSVSGSFSVELYLTGSTDPTYNWHYVTTPVDGHSKTAIQSAIGNTNNLLNYLETAVTTDRQAGWQWHDGYGGDTEFTSLYTNQGYNMLLRNSADRTAVFTGTILPGSDLVFSNLTCGTGDEYIRGWNLVGNPFTCGVDAETFTFTNLEPTLYYTTGNNYSNYNTLTQQSTNGGPRFLPGLQGFFVHATASSPSLTIPASGRSYQAAPILKSTGSSVNYPLLKLKVNGGPDKSDEALVYFFEDAKYSFDGNYDAYKLLSEDLTIPQIYTTVNNIKFAMNGLPLPELKSEIPLIVRTGEAMNYTINVLNLENLDNYRVTLVHGDIKTDLKSNPSYTFLAGKGTLTNMSIVFENSLTTVPEQVKTNSECWYANGVVRLKPGTEGFENNSVLLIYDMNGKIVFRKNNISLTGGEITEIPVSLSRGIYVLKAVNGSKQIVKKIVIAK